MPRDVLEGLPCCLLKQGEVNPEHNHELLHAAIAVVLEDLSNVLFQLSLAGPAAWLGPPMPNPTLQTPELRWREEHSFFCCCHPSATRGSSGRMAILVMSLPNCAFRMEQHSVLSLLDGLSG